VSTVYFAHFNRAHLLGDALAFAFWAACLEQRGSVRLATRLLVTTVGSSLVFLAFFPEVHEYRGLSAIDCALAAELAALGLEGRWRAGDVTGMALFAVVGVAFVAKTAFEFLAGHAVLAPRLGDSVSLLPVAHLAGIVLGLSCWAVDRATVRTWARPGKPAADRVRRRATPASSISSTAGRLLVRRQNVAVEIETPTASSR